MERIGVLWAVSTRCICACLILAVAGLSGCAGTAPPTAEPLGLPAPMPRPPAPTATHDPLADFERGQLQRATASERQGRLADAAQAWEVLTVLRPQDAEYARRLQQLRQRIGTAAAEGMARAAEEQRRGDPDRAARAYLQVLALSPEHRGAADALRAVERERNQRNFVGRFSRNTLPRSMAADTEPRPVASTDRNLVEHASMLAGQGEIDAAIALVVRPANAHGADQGLRRLLGDLYFRKAELLVPQNVREAIAALEKSLKADPAHRAAKARLQTLRAPALK